MSKRENDAFLRNRRPMKQDSLVAFKISSKQKMLKKGLKVRILYNADDIELARCAMATLERWGYLCELVSDE